MLLVVVAVEMGSIFIVDRQRESEGDVMEGKEMFL